MSVVGVPKLIFAAFALPLLRSIIETVPLAFYEAMRTQGGYTEVQYGVIAAMAVMYLLPVMVVFFGARRLMIRGLMNSTRGL